MRIGIIGAGNMGRALAHHFVRLDHDVSIANSRGPESLTALAAEIGAAPVSVVDAANAGDIVVIGIPTKAILDLPRTLLANLPSSVVVIDIGNYHPQLRDGRIDTIERGMPDSQWVAQRIGRPVIKAFNNILATSLLEKGVPRGTAGRIALSVVGDSSDAKAAVLRLVDDLGFDPVDGGDLDNSWRQQPGTPAYCRDLGADALRRALAEADPSRIAEYRAEEEARIQEVYRSADYRKRTMMLENKVAVIYGAGGAIGGGLRPQRIPETGRFKQSFELYAKASGMTREQFHESLASRTHMRRLSTLAEMANVAVFMASDRASGMTGTVVNLSMGSLDD